MTTTTTWLRLALPGACLSLLAACSMQGPTLTCGSGTTQQGAVCVASPFCDPGTHLDGGACVADVTDAGPPVACGQGTVLEGSTCVPAAGASVPASTWVPSIQVAAAGVSHSESPQIAVNSAGDIFVAGLEVFTSTAFSDAILWVSHDHGHSFALLEDRRATTGTVQSTSVAVDHSDRVVWAWTTLQNSAGSLVGSVFVSISDDGVTFASDRQINQPDSQNPYCADAWLSVDRTGNLFLSWTYGSFSGTTVQFGARFAENTDVGAGLGAPIDLAQPVPATMGFRAIMPSGPLAFDPSRAAAMIVEDESYDPTGTLALDSVNVIRRGLDGTQTTPLLSGETGRYFTVHPLPMLVSDSSGALTAAFIDGTSRQEQIYVAHSADGSLWSAAALLNEGTVAGGATLPWLAIDERDRVHALWLDNRSGAWVPYTALSRDGLRFEASEQVGDQSFVEDGTATRAIGAHLSLVIRGGQRYAAWTDTRSGQSQIRFATAPEPP
jgi:hypothetical protein